MEYSHSLQVRPDHPCHPKKVKRAMPSININEYSKLGQIWLHRGPQHRVIGTPRWQQKMNIPNKNLHSKMRTANQKFVFFYVHI
jgi:hypothetical protein